MHQQKRIPPLHLPDDRGLLPDLLAERLEIVFCGTAASAESHRRKAYYAHPQNRFYAILDETGLTPFRLAPADYPRLLSFGIGLTDLNKIQSGADHSLNPACFNPTSLTQKILLYQPQWLAFTSKTAALRFFDIRTIDYGALPTSIGSTKLFVLPSTSGRANAYWNPCWWQKLALSLKNSETASTNMIEKRPL